MASLKTAACRRGLVEEMVVSSVTLSNDPPPSLVEVVSFSAVIFLPRSVSLTSIVIKCLTLHFSTLGGPFPLATLTSAALATPSLPRSNSTTLASYQNIRLTLSSFRMTISPTLTEGP